MITYIGRPAFDYTCTVYRVRTGEDMVMRRVLTVPLVMLDCDSVTA